jgi:hypothetical protein
MLELTPAELPTAIHIVDDVQETALNCGPLPRPVVGTVWAVQAVPFQLAAVGAYVLPLPLAVPTAVQKVVLGHDTPARPLSVKPAKLGLVTTVHKDPFHCSISVFEPTKPTAIHSVAVAQLTAERPPSPLREGVVTNVHVEPVHCSTSGSGRPATVWLPTPTQKSALAQETPPKEPSVTAGALVAAVQVDAVMVAGTVGFAAPPGAAPRNSQAPMSAQAKTGAAMRTADFI